MSDKLLIVAPSLKIGGMQNYVKNIANAFIEQNLEVSIFVFSGSKVEVQLNPAITVHKISCEYRMSKYFSAIYKLFKLRSLVTQKNYKTIFSISGMHSTYVIISLLFTDCNVFVSDRSSPLLKYSHLTELLKRVFYPMASGVLLQTALSKEIIDQRYKLKNSFVIPNPVNILTNLKVKKRKNQIITVARLVKSKRIDILIKIFAQLKYNEEWKLLIIGDGPERENLEKAAHETYGLNNVKFIGSTINVNDYLLESKVFAFTSESEGFPNALCEAMAAGCACISFNCVAGPSELITNGLNGFLITDGNITSFKEHLELLINSPKLIEDFSSKGYNSIQKFELAAISSQIIKEFRKRTNSL